MLIAAILLALAMERPLIFFTDAAGRLSQGPLAEIPTETLRFDTNHVAEAYGVISAALERDLIGRNSFTTNYTSGVGINADELTFALLPLIGDDPWNDNGFDFATNRIIRTYRLWSPALNNNYRGDALTAWHYAANKLYYNDGVRRACGRSSSLFCGDDPPLFDWCAYPWIQATPDRWRDSWLDWCCISNDVLAAWGDFQGESFDDTVFSLAQTFLEFSESDGSYALDDAQWAQMEAMLNPRQIITNRTSALMAQALPGCNPSAITNRTLRFDRQFLTAFEAAAVLPDTYIYDFGYPIYNHLWLDRQTRKTWTANIRATLNISATADGGYSVTFNLPTSIDWNVSETYSVTTNQTSVNEPFGGLPYWRVWMSDNASATASGEASVDITLESSARDVIIAWLDATWPDSASPVITYDWNGATTSMALSYVGDYSGAPGVSAIIPSTPSCYITLRIYGSNYGESVQVAGMEPAWLGSVTPLLYWRNNRVDADLYLQEMMRWTTATNEVRTGESAEIKLSGYGGTGTAQYRHRKGVSTQGVSYAMFTNQCNAAAQSLSDACRAKCESLSGVSFANPISLAPIPDSIRSQGESRFRQAASIAHAGSAHTMESFTVQKRMIGGSSLYLLNGRTWYAGTVVLGQFSSSLLESGDTDAYWTEPIDATIQPAAVQGRQATRVKETVRFYNLSLPNSLNSP